MQITVGKVLSVLIAVAWATACIIDLGVTQLLWCLIALLLPLALIWFPDEIGSFTGYRAGHSQVDAKTPPILLSVMGWFFLIGLPVVLYFISRGSR